MSGSKVGIGRSLHRAAMRLKPIVTPLTTPLMSHEERRRLIESPVTVRVWGGHTWGGTTGVSMPEQLHIRFNHGSWKEYDDTSDYL